MKKKGRATAQRGKREINEPNKKILIRHGYGRYSSLYEGYVDAEGAHLERCIGNHFLTPRIIHSNFEVVD